MNTPRQRAAQLVQSPTVDLRELIETLNEDPAVVQMAADVDELPDGRATPRAELLREVAARWPDRYGEMTTDELADLLLCVDLIDVSTKELAERERIQNHPNWSVDEVRRRLTEHMPDKYPPTLTNHAVARILREGGVPVQTVRLHDGTTAKGIRRRDLDAVLSARRA